ncbi:hypothetical protein CWI38_2034p0010 [Hamiltosporidium tvaerminnensis]|uniref:Uncharacterized protein n=1 Tax=Hamiltosporidium tvaerminnensis TaxID=1176355 RepID=A0A4Q9LRE5_9MICR|nr:hypothetical protein CWI38_2034p0010 [Hamiltosporidium tvaerminnensis]
MIYEVDITIESIINTIYYNEKFSCAETIYVFKKIDLKKDDGEIMPEENGERRLIDTCLRDISLD